MKTLRMMGLFQWFKDRGKPPILVSDDPQLENLMETRGFKVIGSTSFGRELNEDMDKGEHISSGLNPDILDHKKGMAKKMDDQRIGFGDKVRETLSGIAMGKEMDIDDEPDIKAEPEMDKEKDKTRKKGLSLDMD
jgi:hypothetical protein